MSVSEQTFTTETLEATNEFATRVALHSLGLTIASVMVRAAAFVARRWTGPSSTSGKPSSEATTIATARNNGTTTSTKTRSALEPGVWARTLWAVSAGSYEYEQDSYSQMTWLATRVTTTPSSSSAYAQSRAVSLDMSKALTMVTLLSCDR